MRSINTTAIIVALITIISFGATVNAIAPIGPGKKNAKPVVTQAPVVIPPNFERPAVPAKTEAPKATVDEKQQGFAESENTAGTSGVSNAIMNLMFGNQAKNSGTKERESSKMTPGRRESPTPKKLY